MSRFHTPPAPAVPAPAVPTSSIPAPATPAPATPAPATPAPATPAPATPALWSPAVYSLALCALGLVALTCAFLFAAPAKAQDRPPLPVTPAPTAPALIAPVPVAPAPVAPAPVAPAPAAPALVAPAPPILPLAPSAVFTSPNGLPLGGAVAVSGNWLAASLSTNSPNISNIGLYHRTAATAPWQLHSTIAPPTGPTTGNAYAGFGSRLALDGDTLVVGAPYAELPTFRQGAVYVYHLVAGVWTPAATLLPSDPTIDLQFGDALAIEGATIVVGAYGGGFAHAAYIFARSGTPPTWREVAALLPQTPSDYGHTKAVAIKDTTVVVGTPIFSRVYLFARDAGGPDQWGEVAMLKGAAGSRFGTAVALLDDVLAVSAPDVFEGAEGDITLYRADSPASWQPYATIARPENFLSFGATLVAGDNLLLATGRSASGADNPVPVYVRNFGGPDAWGHALDLLPGSLGLDPVASFGGSVDLDGSSAVVGAPLAPGFATYVGVEAPVYFDVSSTPTAAFPGSQLAWSVRLYNATPHALTAAELTVALPPALTLAAPVTLTPAQPGARLATTNADLPTLASSFVVSPGFFTTIVASVEIPAATPIDTTLAATFTLRAESPTGSFVRTAPSRVPTRRQSSYLPLLLRPAAVYYRPGDYPVNRCDTKPLLINAVDVGQLYLCVQSVTVRANGLMQFNLAWVANLVDLPYIEKYSDAGNTNMYLTDSFGTRYDHIATGGAAQGATLFDGQPVYGWFVFPPATRAGATFTFHDDDQALKIPDITLPQ